MNYSELSEEGKELYSYMKTNPEPMKVLERAYRRTETQLKSYGNVTDLAVVGAILHCAQMYSKAHSTGDDALSLFPRLVRVQVRKVLIEEFRTEIEAGNSWLATEAI